MMMNCPKCGKEVEQVDNFCKSCNYNLVMGNSRLLHILAAFFGISGCLSLFLAFGWFYGSFFTPSSMTVAQMLGYSSFIANLTLSILCFWAMRFFLTLPNIITSGSDLPFNPAYALATGILWMIGAYMLFQVREKFMDGSNAWVSYWVIFFAVYSLFLAFMGAMISRK